MIFPAIREDANRIYHSGLWFFEKNPKHPESHYFYHLPFTLDAICNKALVFHTNSDLVARRVGALAKIRNISLETVVSPIERLPCYGDAVEVSHSATAMNLDVFEKPINFGGEKGLFNYWHHVKASNPKAYTFMLAIWLSKVSLVAGFMRTEKTMYQHAWIDASLSRMDWRRSNWDISRVPIVGGKVSHYDSRMRMFGQQLPLTAGFLAADAYMWNCLERLFKESLRSAKAMPYAHDEETILANCVAKRPDWFFCIGNHYKQSDRLKNAKAKLIRRVKRH